MAKKDKKSKEAKKLRTAEKAKKNQSKAEIKDKKVAKKLGEEEEDEDIDQILEQFAKEQALFEEVNITVTERPSKRLNPTMVANPINGKREFMLFGGESNDGSIAHFYNDLYVYTVDNDTWRKISSKNAPLPRSSHAMCSHPSGIILMFGGEFSSPKQSTFYHYGDTWILDADSKEWSKIDQKKGPSARSGHRLAVWKNYIMLYGGFRDLGNMSTYLNDLWLFDVTTYKWTQVEFPQTHTIPDARSGHSFLPCADGAIVYGGYCKVKAKKGLQKGKVLTDCWVLKMKSDPKAIRFERKKKQGSSPTARVGCSLVYHKNRGIMFGGVYDYEESEEQLDSEFYNTLYSYHIETNRWYNVSLKRQRAPKRERVKERSRDEDLEILLNSILAKAKLNDDDEEEDGDKQISEIERLRQKEELEEAEEEKIVYPIMNQLPHKRFNSTLCVVDDTLFIYGGIFERGEQEFNLDSLYAIDLGKVDGVKVLWEDLTEMEKDVVNSDDEDEDDDDDDDDDDEEDEDVKLEAEDEDEEEEEEEEEEDEIPDPRPWLPHPKAFESLRAFYVRTGPNFLEWSISSHRDERGKYLKKAAFDLCEERFWERREQVAIEEDRLEDLGGVGDIIEKDTSKVTKRR
ncbi:hypothetical protein DFJ63DRAFT_8947 [Scheffersomyces coipomensis]|uniref:uncharacterized protein n=1 Tax=Scheffersomyces coipomensis TaxID=1788519 RepID=UPI00315D1D5A